MYGIYKINSEGIREELRLAFDTEEEAQSICDSLGNTKFILIKLKGLVFGKKV